MEVAFYETKSSEGVPLKSLYGHVFFSHIGNVYNSNLVSLHEWEEGHLDEEVLFPVSSKFGWGVEMTDKEGRGREILSKLFLFLLIVHTHKQTNGQTVFFSIDMGGRS